MDNQELADNLDMIAMNNGWSGDALLAAERHSVTTFNDRILIRRYQHGINRGTDHVRLQEIAIYIREAGEA